MVATTLCVFPGNDMYACVGETLNTNDIPHPRHGATHARAIFSYRVINETIVVPKHLHEHVILIRRASPTCFIQNWGETWAGEYMCGMHGTGRDPLEISGVVCYSPHLYTAHNSK